MKYLIVLCVALISFASCTKTPEKPFIEITGIDHTLRPGDNFFRYVNVKWYDRVSIPSPQAGLLKNNIKI